MIVKIHKMFAAEKSTYKEDPNCKGKIKDQIKDAYLELMGPDTPTALKGTAPVVVELSAADGRKKSKAVREKATVSEYRWCVGITGKNVDWYDSLNNDDPIVVQLLFHTRDSGYDIQEVAADLKLIPPFFSPKPPITQRVSETLHSAGDVAGSVLQFLGQDAAGKLLSKLSKKPKQISVPAEKFAWYVKMFSVDMESGIEWHIPRVLIEAVGNRIVGSAGVIFTAVSNQDSQQEPNSSPKADLSIEMRAFLRDGCGNEVFLCPIDQLLQLKITPE